jgi:hypothetical protein
MTQYEYKVVPAPAKGLKAEGIKTPEARFANALGQLMNEMGGHGWEYMRADTLPSTERSGLTGSTTEWRNMLIFRRAVLQADSDATALPDTPVQVATPVVPTPVAAPVVAAPVTSPVTHDTAKQDAPQDETPDTTDVVAQDTTVDETADTSPDQTPAADADPDVDPDEQKTPRAGATHMLSDNGVEETSEVSGMSSSLQNLASNRSRLKGVTRSDK